MQRGTRQKAALPKQLSPPPRQGVSPPRVVVSMTTVPWRIEYLPFIIEKILAQTRVPDQIYLGVADACRRKNTPYDAAVLEEYVARFAPHLKITKMAEDYGAVCKVLGGVFAESDPNTIIITIDDDTAEMPPNFIENFEHHCRHIDATCVWATRGKQLGRFPFMYGYSNFENGGALPSFFQARVTESAQSAQTHTGPPRRVIQMLSGFGGVAYRRKFFPYTPEDWQTYFFKFSQFPSLCMHDDVWLAAYLSTRHIPTHQLLNADTVLGELRMRDANGDGLSGQKLDFGIQLMRAVKDARKLGAFQQVQAIDNPYATGGFVALALLGAAAFATYKGVSAATKRRRIRQQRQ